MTNYFDQLKNEILTGAESGFFGEENNTATNNPYEDMEFSTNEIENIRETASAIYNDRIQEIAAGELAAGGESAIKRAAYRTKTMAKGAVNSLGNSLGKLSGRTSNIDKILTNVSKKAKDAHKALEKSGLPKDTEAKMDYPTGLAGYIGTVVAGLDGYITALSNTATGIGGVSTAAGLAEIKLHMFEKDSNKASGIGTKEVKVPDLKKTLEDYEAGDILDAAKEAHEKVLDETKEITLASAKTAISKDLEAVFDATKGVKKIKANNASSNLRKAAGKIASTMNKIENLSETEKATALDNAQQLATAVSGQIGILTRLIKFLELASEKIVTSSRALEAKLPSRD